MIVDQDFVEELNKVSNRTLEVLSVGKEREAQALSEELQSMREILEEENDHESSRFIRVLQGLLNHTVLKEAQQLEGMYSAAADRIFNQIAGSDWKLLEEGKTAAPEEPKFSTWDDIFNRHQEQQQQQQQQAQPSSERKDTSFYRLLGVDPAAEPGTIKAAYRKLALKLHPDVNSAPDATERFAEVSSAYDVLSDPVSRDLYDEHGSAMGSYRGADSGRGNARDAWDEFKPFQRENKHTRARAAARTEDAESSSTADDQGTADDERRIPQVGDIVEYPLRTIETEDFADGRSHGVGLLVGRNIDRGDAEKLPEDLLSMCEIESLRQEEPDSNRWIADELGISSFARLEEMRVVPVAAFDTRHDIWTIDAVLSPGCGGPPLPEEIIL